MRDDIYDIFISHASEDKSLYVRPLASELRRLGLLVWYDEFSLKPGDSIRQAIDRGLAGSWHGLLVISEAFLSKRWTDWEVNALVQSCLGHVSRRVIPIWLGVERSDILEWSLPIADLKAIVEDDPIKAAHQVYSAVGNDNVIWHRQLGAENAVNIQITETLDAAKRLLCMDTENVSYALYAVEAAKKSQPQYLRLVNYFGGGGFFGDMFIHAVQGKSVNDILKHLIQSGPIITEDNPAFSPLIVRWDESRPTRKALLVLPMLSNSYGVMHHEPTIEYFLVLLAPTDKQFERDTHRMVDIATMLGSVFHFHVNRDERRDDHIQISVFKDI